VFREASSLDKVRGLWYYLIRYTVVYLVAVLTTEEARGHPAPALVGSQQQRRNDRDPQRWRSFLPGSPDHREKQPIPGKLGLDKQEKMWYYLFLCPLCRSAAGTRCGETVFFKPDLDRSQRLW
jgi:hypothetical protein